MELEQINATVSMVKQLFNDGYSMRSVAHLAELEIAEVEKILDDLTKPFVESSQSDFIRSLRTLGIVK
jgi:hypothetical protein